MGFGDNVTALLETYDNCVALLKAFKRQKKQDGGRKAAKINEQQALLKRSLKTDRKKVEAAYASRLSESGGRFEHGDSKAKSALSKVMKRLNAVIAGLIRAASSSTNPAMDYQSLTSLSHSSRIQAIKAFDSLSHRLDSKSSLGSIASASTSKSSRSSNSSKSSKSAKTTKSSKTIKSVSTTKSSSSKASDSVSSQSSKDSKLKKKTKEAKSVPRSETQLVRADTPRPQETQIVRTSARRHDRALLPPARLGSSIQTPLLDAMERREEDRMLRRRPSRIDRFSLVSVSSGSTKLGEIPERKWFRGYDDWSGHPDEYNTPIVYPLRPYGPPPVAVKERKFLSFFRRGN